MININNNQNNTTCDNINYDQQNSDDVGFLSSLFVNSIYKGVSLMEFVCPINKTISKKEEKDELGNKKKEDIKENKIEEIIETLKGTEIKINKKAVDIKENKIKNKKEIKYKNKNKKPNHHTESQKASNRVNSSITNDNTPKMSKSKNTITISKKTSCKSISMSNCSQEEQDDSLIKTYKVSSETEKQKRLYEEKVKAMQNRLNALKKQEDDIFRKMNLYHNKERELEQIKEEKKILKNILNSYKYNQKEMLEAQKRKNNEIKEKVTVNVQKAIMKMKIKKHDKFDLARTKKQLVNTMISETSYQQDIINQKKIEIIKGTYESFKAEEKRKRKERENKLKKNYLSKIAKDEEETQVLKDQIAEMERLEEQYVQSLRTTQKQNEKLFKGSWILKIGEGEQTYLKINNVSIGTGSYTGKRLDSAKKINANNSKIIEGPKIITGIIQKEELK